MSVFTKFAVYRMNCNGLLVIKDDVANSAYMLQRKCYLAGIYLFYS